MSIIMINCRFDKNNVFVMVNHYMLSFFAEIYFISENVSGNFKIGYAPVGFQIINKFIFLLFIGALKITRGCRILFSFFVIPTAGVRKNNNIEFNAPIYNRAVLML